MMQERTLIFLLGWSFPIEDPSLLLSTPVDTSAESQVQLITVLGSFKEYQFLLENKKNWHHGVLGRKLVGNSILDSSVTSLS